MSKTVSVGGGGVRVVCVGHGMRAHHHVLPGRQGKGGEAREERDRERERGRGSAEGKGRKEFLQGSHRHAQQAET